MFLKGFAHHAFRKEQDPAEKHVQKYRKHDQWHGRECTQKQIMSFHSRNVHKTQKRTHLNSIPLNTEPKRAVAKKKETLKNIIFS